MAVVKQKRNTQQLVIGALVIALAFTAIGYKLGTSDTAIRNMLTKKYSALLLAPIVNSHNAQLFFSYDRATLNGWKEDQSSKSSFVFQSFDMEYDAETAQLAKGSYINVTNNTLVDEKKFRSAVSELARNAGVDESAIESLTIDGREALGYRHAYGTKAVGYTYHVAGGGLLWSINMVSAENDVYERDLPAFKEFASSFNFN